MCNFIQSLGESAKSAFGRAFQLQLPVGTVTGQPPITSGQEGIDIYTRQPSGTFLFSFSHRSVCVDLPHPHSRYRGCLSFTTSGSDAGPIGLGAAPRSSSCFLSLAASSPVLFLYSNLSLLRYGGNGRSALDRQQHLATQLRKLRQRSYAQMQSLYYCGLLQHGLSEGSLEGP
jgi:hypothetical protein